MARIAWAVVTGSSAGSNGAFWLPFGATLVIGSESLNSTKNWQELRASFGGSLALSLDFIAEGPRGLQALFIESGHWPKRVIAMSLDRVGTAHGPDVARLASVVNRAGSCGVYASGGIREIRDLEAVVDVGAQGALLATALHRGAITQDEIAAFLQRRRSDQIRNRAF